jgi:hypothetical protein
MKTRTAIAGAVLVGTVFIGGLGISLAQQAGIKRTLLLK